MPGILLAIGYVALLLLLMRRTRFYNAVPGLSLRWVAGIFLLKVLAGTVLWAIYTWIYTDRATADVFKYFDDSAVMFSALHDRPLDYVRMLFGIGNDTPWFTERYYMVMNNWFREYESNLYNDAHTVIRFNALVRLISFGEFHVHTVVAAFLSLTGMVGLYRAFVGFLAGRERALMVAVFLVPSVLLWASGVIKESLLFFGLGLLTDQTFRMIQGRIRPFGLLVLACCAVLLFFLKFYVLLSLLPALVLFAWSRRPRPALGVKTVTVYAVCFGLVLAAPHLIRGFDILAIIALKQKDFIGLVQEAGSGSFVMPPRLAPDLLSFIKLAPYALYIALIGPLVHSGGGALGLFATVENAALVLVLAVCLRYRRPWAQVNKGLLTMLLCYVVVLALVIGWTTPVMGALVRYRTPLLPFLLIAGLLLLDPQRLALRFPRIARRIAA